MQDDPLIVPADLALGQLEDLFSRLIGKRRILTQVVDHRVMKAQRRDVELADNDILIVPAIAQDDAIVGITR